MRYRLDANLDAAMDLRRAVPISNLRAIGFASVALLLILGYGVFGYLDQRARAAVAKKLNKPPATAPASMPSTGSSPASAPAGR